MSTTKIQRTYGRNRRNLASSLALPSSPPSALASSSPAPSPGPTRPSKRRFADMSVTENTAPLLSPRKRVKSLPKSSTSTTPKSNAKGLFKSKSSQPKAGQQKMFTQLHFNIDQSILRTCSLCDLSYTKGAPDDEALHRAHCARVRQGLEWGREEEKDRLRGMDNVVVEVESDLKLKGSKKKGRILCLPADIGGKLGAKLATLLRTINLSLSAPPLLPSVLQCSKAYLFLLPHETLNYREHIVGCVIAQRISTAMAVVPPPSSTELPDPAGSLAAVVVDTETNLFCSPAQLPTPMGIPRLFVSVSHRRLGIAQALLDAAASTFIYGCPLDPLSGQIAFSQPTGMGQAVMKNWGKGNVRIFEE